MPNNKWDDDHIENLLKDFPAIKDARPKEEVYRRLQQDAVPKKKSKRWIPYLVAALAFITFGVLLASMLGQNGSSFDMSSSESSQDTAEMDSTAGDANVETESESAEMGSSEEAADSASGSDMFNSMESAALTGASIYPEELQGKVLFKIGLTENATVIPVSILLSEDQVAADFGTAEVDAVELYNLYAAQIDEQELGFDDYHPYSGTVRKGTDGIVHRVPEGHNYDLASAAMTVYFNSLSVTFGDEGQIAITDESGNPAVFDQVGPVEPVKAGLDKIAYYSYTAANGSAYLMPGFDMPFENAAEALDAMKSSAGDMFVSVIPDGVDYSISETDRTVTVEFNDTIDLDAYGYEESLRMIEGMALAADSFEKELVIENTVQDSWDRFDFTGPLPVPEGINRIPFE